MAAGAVGGAGGPQVPQFTPKTKMQARWEAFKIKVRTPSEEGRINAIYDGLKGGMDPYTLARFSTHDLTLLSKKLTRGDVQEFQAVLEQAQVISKASKQEALQEALNKLKFPAALTSQPKQPIQVIPEEVQFIQIQHEIEPILDHFDSQADRIQKLAEKNDDVKGMASSFTQIASDYMNYAADLKKKAENPDFKVSKTEIAQINQFKNELEAKLNEIIGKIIVSADDIISQAMEEVFPPGETNDKESLQAKEIAIVFGQFASAIGEIPKIELKNVEDVKELALSFPKWCEEHKEALAKITTLYLPGSKLHHLPKEIGLLTGLEELRLYGFKGKQLPEEIIQLRKLRNLYLQDSAIESMPAGIEKLRLNNLIVPNKKMYDALPKKLKDRLKDRGGWAPMSVDESKARRAEVIKRGWFKDYK